MRFFFASTLVALLASAAQAATTSWTNPRGGAWSDAANWSAGVPGANDVAVLPPLRRGAYQITFDRNVGAKSLIVSGAVTLTGAASVTTFDGIDVGVGASVDGLLTLDGVSIFTFGTMRVGTDGGVGALSLPGSSDSMIGATDSVFGSGSTLKIVLEPGMQPVLGGLNAVFGGALDVTLAPDAALPLMSATRLAVCANASSGAFANVATPSAFGQQAPITYVNGFTLGKFDPVTELTIEQGTPFAYVGFAEPLAASASLMSGATVGICCEDIIGDASWSVSPSDLAVIEEGHHDDRFLRGLAPGDAMLTLTYVSYGALLSTTQSTEVLANSGIDIEAVDVSANGEQPSELGYAAWIAPYVASTLACSAEGRFVAFAHTSDDLVPGSPESDESDIFVKDRVTGAIEIVSAQAVPQGAEEYASSPDLSADGRFVTFMVGNSGEFQAWIHDRLLGTTALVSHAMTGGPGNDPSFQPQISADGTTVVFSSFATDLVPGGVTGVFAYDVATQAISLVSESAHSPSVSSDARFVAYVIGFDEPQTSVWVKDRAKGTVELVSVSTDSVPANGNSDAPAMDDSGNVIAFRSAATNLAVTEMDEEHLYVRDRSAGTTTLLSGPAEIEACAIRIAAPDISANGEFVAYEPYWCYECTPHDGTVTSCAILRVNVITGESDFIAQSPWGAPKIGWTARPALSADGSRAFFFPHFADDLVPNGEEVMSSYFVRTYQTRNAADLDRDGIVGPLDLAILLGAWGSTNPGDLDGDGIVGPADIGVLLGAWTTD